MSYSFMSPDRYEVELKKKKIQQYLTVSEELFNRGEITIGQTSENFIAGLKTIFFETSVYGRDFEYPLEVPLNPIDMWREKYFPKFLTKWFPIKKRKVLLKWSEIFPDIPEVPESMGLRFAVMPKIEEISYGDV